MRTGLGYGNKKKDINMSIFTTGWEAICEANVWNALCRTNVQKFDYDNCKKLSEASGLVWKPIIHRGSFRSAVSYYVEFDLRETADAMKGILEESVSGDKLLPYTGHCSENFKVKYSNKNEKPIGYTYIDVHGGYSDPGVCEDMISVLLYCIHEHRAEIDSAVELSSRKKAEYKNLLEEANNLVM